MRENADCPPGGRSWPAALAAAAVWSACLLRYGLAHPPMAGVAAGGATYAGLLAAGVWFLVRRPAGADRLRATGSGISLRAWPAVALVTLAWAFLYGFAFGGVAGGVHIPVLTPWIAGLNRWRLARGVDGTTLLNFASLGLLPAAILLALGARRREIGLATPVAGTRLASVACLILPALMVAWAVVAGKVTAPTLLVLALHSLLSNGFCEEMMCRGVLLPPLRASGSTAWAVVIQGLLFGLVHVGGAIPEEGGDAVLAVAAAVALNFPMGTALGFVAVRTGSLALPVAIHVSLHLMKDVLR